MRILLTVDGHPPSACTSYDHHVHAEITRVRASDPREPGTSRHEPVSVTRPPDHLTPVLFEACATGRRLDRVTLAVEAPHEGPLLTLTLSRVYVISVLSSAGGDGPVETIQLDYGAVQWTHSVEGASVSTSWTVFAAHDDP